MLDKMLLLDINPKLYIMVTGSVASYLIIKQLKGGRSKDAAMSHSIAMPNIVLPCYQPNASSVRSVSSPFGCSISTCHDLKVRHDMEITGKAAWDI
jgi:hypothetical protein